MPSLLGSLGGLCQQGIWRWKQSSASIAFGHVVELPQISLAAVEVLPDGNGSIFPQEACASNSTGIPSRAFFSSTQHGVPVARASNSHSECDPEDEKNQYVTVFVCSR